MFPWLVACLCWPIHLLNRTVTETKINSLCWDYMLYLLTPVPQEKSTELGYIWNVCFKDMIPKLLIILSLGCTQQFSDMSFPSPCSLQKGKEFYHCFVFFPALSCFPPSLPAFTKQKRQTMRCSTPSLKGSLWRDNHCWSREITVPSNVLQKCYSFFPAKHKEGFKLSALENGLIISVWLLACTTVRQIKML